MRNKAVAKAAETFVVQQEEAPDYIKRDGARGSENVTTEDLVIPRLEIAQALSPCVDKEEAAYIDGATPGMLYNSVTRQLYGDSVPFIPVLFKKEYLLWRDRKKGGGFAGAHIDAKAAALAAQEQENPEEWEALETAQHFGLIPMPNGKLEEVCISMAKTKLKVSRNFNSLIRINGGDRFSRCYMVSAVSELNNEGKKYHNFNVKNFGWAKQNIYMAAEEMFESVTSGDRIIEADRSDTDDVAGSGDDGSKEY